MTKYDWVQRGKVLAPEDKNNQRYTVIIDRGGGLFLQMYVERRLTGQALADAIERYGPRESREK